MEKDKLEYNEKNIDFEVSYLYSSNNNIGFIACNWKSNYFYIFIDNFNNTKNTYFLGKYNSYDIARNILIYRLQNNKRHNMEICFKEFYFENNKSNIRYGVWRSVNIGKLHLWECSCCKVNQDVPCYNDGSPAWNFCPECGAKMNVKSFNCNQFISNL